MSRRRDRTRGAGHKREQGWHLAIPHDFINSNLFARLSSSAKVLVYDVGVQYKLDNNGQLRATFEKLKHRGWGSEATLFKARRELEEAGVLFETRKGGRPNRATWYAMTFWDLDPHPDYDIGRGAYPGKGSWRLNRLNGPIAPRPAPGLLQKRKPPSADSASSRSKGSAQASKTVAIRPLVHRDATSISEVDLRGSPICGAEQQGRQGSSAASHRERPAPAQTSAHYDDQPEADHAPSAASARQADNPPVAHPSADGALTEQENERFVALLTADGSTTEHGARVIVRWADDADVRHVLQEAERRGLVGEAARSLMNERRAIAAAKRSDEFRLSQVLAKRMGKHLGLHESSDVVKERARGIEQLREMHDLSRDKIWAEFERFSADQTLRSQVLIPAVLHYYMQQPEPARAA